jgi:hypothetical protein
MSAIADKTIQSRVLRGEFSPDEIGWVAADAEVQSVLQRAGRAGLPRAHEKVPALGLLAGHPRLRAHVGDFGVADSIYFRSWDGNGAVAADGTGPVAVVFLGWRGALTIGNESVRSEPGTILIVDRSDVASIGASGPAGPLLVVSFSAVAETLPNLPDNCLWPSAWCVAG